MPVPNNTFQECSFIYQAMTKIPGYIRQGLEPDIYRMLGTDPGLGTHYQRQPLSCCGYWELCWTRCSTQIHPSLLGTWLASELGRGPQEHHTHLETNPSMFLALNLTP